MAQAENTQALVLQQPNGQKVYLDLTHSTDTTAIWSFGVAMVIAIGLGSLATWLAYCYGKRSFDLTTQSFEAVIKQIQSSERINSEMNKMLIDAQHSLKIKELKIIYRGQEINKLREIVAEYINVSAMIHYIYNLNHCLINPERYLYVHIQGTYENSLHIKLLTKVEELHISIARTKLYLDITDNTHMTVLKFLDSIILETVFMVAGDYEEIKFNNIANSYKEKLKRITDLLNLLIKKEILENKGE